MRALLSGLILGAIPAGVVAAVIYAVPNRPAASIDHDGPTVAGNQADIRAVRVLIGSGVGRLRIRASATIQIQSEADDSLGTLAPDAWIEITAMRERGLMVGDGLELPPIAVLHNASEVFNVSFSGDGDAREFPGLLRVVRRDDGRLDVINEVDVESYVACVTASEIWPTFHVQACRAQAIVARSYVLYQMSRRNHHSFDVSATQSSQVYAGLRFDATGKRAAQATQYTRGVVLTWHDGASNRLFCTYYSAACGGVTQSAALFGPDGDIPPLAGGVHCDYCRIAPGETYRWGPVRMDWAEFRERLVQRYPDVASLGILKSVQIVERTKHGRALTIRITGTSGEPHEILAERLRYALDAGTIRSTAFTTHYDRHGVVFSGGKGFGHGLGLCQWGMEGQAREDRSVGAILQYYYPGARLTRVY